MTTYPIIHPTVDIALIFRDKILLGRKKHQELFRFVGGYVDINDSSYEAAAIREAEEETGYKNIKPIYVGSQTIPDPRYDGITEGIKTSLFFALVDHNKAVALDDIIEVKWFDLKRLNVDLFVEEHKELAQYFINTISPHLVVV